MEPARWERNDLFFWEKGLVTSPLQWSPLLGERDDALEIDGTYNAIFEPQWSPLVVSGMTRA
jgi:hypothetical protein